MASRLYNVSLYAQFTKRVVHIIQACVATSGHDLVGFDVLWSKRRKGAPKPAAALTKMVKTQIEATLCSELFRLIASTIESFK